MARWALGQQADVHIKGEFERNGPHDPVRLDGKTIAQFGGKPSGRPEDQLPVKAALAAVDQVGLGGREGPFHPNDRVRPTVVADSV